MSTVRDRVVTVAFRMGWAAGRVLPPRATAGVLDRAAEVSRRRSYRRGGTAIRQLRRNLSRVCPDVPQSELDTLVSDAWRSYARYWQEVFRLPWMDLPAFQRQLNGIVTGQRWLHEALEEGRGAILALPHSGNWDVAGVWLAGQVGSFATVAERLEPESLYRRFVAYRRSLGFEVLPFGDMGSLRVLLARLRANGVVCLLADRDLNNAGVPVRFFGEHTTIPSGPAWLAKRTGAALLPIGSWFTPDAWGIHIHPPLPVEGIASASQALVDVFAGDIAEHPADWHMLQPLWSKDR